MKKLLVMLLATVLLTFTVCAAETVIYENDFSDPATLWDFTQYRMRWEVRDGGLYMTDEPLSEAGKVNINDAIGQILYIAPEELTDYVVDVDLMKACTQSGVIVRSQANLASHKQSGFAGYLAFVSQDVTQGALGAGSLKGDWAGVLNTGVATRHLEPGVNLHFNIIVKGQKLGVKVTNIDSGKIVYDVVYSIGSNAKLDAIFTSGSFGLRMRAKYGDKIAANNAYFDNLVVTTANEAVPAVTPVSTYGKKIDVKGITPVYTNSFDSPADIAEFTQYFGTWDVVDGKLMLVDVTDAASSYILYTGDEKLTTLKDYVLDVDVYNVQTQAGALVRCHLPTIQKLGEVDKDGNNFCGYTGYIAFLGNQVAIGYGGHNGKWGGLVDNAASPKDIFTPTSDVHLQVAVQDTNVQVTVSDLNGKVLWMGVKYHDMWDEGTFGFRMYAKLRDDGLDNVSNTGWDNLVISTFGGADKTEIKMTIDSLTATVNGEAKTLDAAPIIRNSRTMLPVRFVAENLGATVSWDDATKTVTVKSADTTIEIVIGATTAKVNGKEIALDSPAFIENSRTYLPVRVVAENLGATVGWDDATKTATLTK
ncbi:MAG: copper amine oxidase N-terminal domain-containing protein [Clostridia bacterium]|nr:copper amine oxidase N-terminal domain-containing protein [Clostridia bacterium]